ncbi:MAG: carboxypeptidase regulatory-like domain-containing protein [Planctomycetota bacterium]
MRSSHTLGLVVVVLALMLPVTATLHAAPPIKVDCRGTVVDDETGEPLAGVRVSFIEYKGSSPDRIHLRPSGTTTTASDGRFELSTAARAYQHMAYVLLQKDGYISQRTRGWPRSFDWTHRLGRGRPLTVHAKTPNGETLAGAWMDLTLRGPKVHRLVGTATFLSLWFDGPGPYTIYVGGQSMNVSLSSDTLTGYSGFRSVPEGSIDVALTSHDVITGRVVDASGRGINDVRIKVTDGKASSGWTLADGSFRIFQREGDSWKLELSHPDHLPIEISIGPDTVQPETYVLGAARTLTFRLVDADDNPIWTHGLKLLVDDEKVPVRALNDGVVHFGSLDPASTRGSLQFRAYDDVELVWKPGAGPVDLGTVVASWVHSLPFEVVGPDGKAPRHSSVSAVQLGPVKHTRAWGNGDENGYGVVPGLQPGRWRLTASGHNLRKETREVVVVPGENPTQTFRLNRGGTLLFDLQLPNGDMAHGARVRVSKEGYNGLGFKHDIRRWRGSGLPTEVGLTLEFSTEDQINWSLDVPALAEAEVRDLGVLQFPTGITLEGQITNDIRDAVADAYVRLSGASQARMTKSDPAGRYRFDNVQSGQYELSVRGKDHERHEGTVVIKGNASTAVHDVRVGRTVARRIRVAFPDGRIPAHAVMRISGVHNKHGSDDIFVHEETGIVEIPPLPDGPVELTLLCNWRKPKRYSFPSPDALPLELVISPGVRLRITLDMPEGVKLPDWVTVGKGTQKVHSYWGSELPELTEDGVYLVEDLDPSIKSVTVHARHYDLPPPQHVTVQTSDEPQDLHFVIRDHATPYDFSVRYEDGAPIEGAKVTLYKNYVGATDGETDAHGLCTILSYAAIDDVGVAVDTEPGFRAFPEEIPKDGSRFAVTIERSYKVPFQVFDHEEKPVDNVSLSLHSAGMAKTDMDGRAAISKVRRGPATVAVRRDHHFLKEFPIEVRDGRLIELRLPAPIRVTGRVSIDGEHATGGRIAINFEGSEDRAQQRFECVVKSDGSFERLVYERGAATVLYIFPYTGSAARPTLHKQLQLEGDTDAALAFHTHRVSGVALDVSGAAVADAFLYARRPDGGGASTRTDSDGRFSLTIQQGRANFLVTSTKTKSVFLPQEHDVKGSLSLRLEAVPTLKARVRVSGASTEHVNAYLRFSNMKAYLPVTQANRGVVDVLIPHGEHEVWVSASVPYEGRVRGSIVPLVQYIGRATLRAGDSDIVDVSVEKPE